MRLTGLQITSAFFLALLENQNNVCQLSVKWDLSRFPRPLRNNTEVSQDDISQHSEYFRMDPIGPHGLICMQVEEQTPHKFRSGWEFTIATVVVLQLRAPVVPVSISPSSVLKTDTKKALNVSASFMFLFVRLLFTSSKELKSSLVLLLLLTYLNKTSKQTNFFHCLPQQWPASALTEHKFSPNKGKEHLCSPPLTLLLVIMLFLFPPNHQKKILVHPSHPSGLPTCLLIFWNCLFLCSQKIFFIFNCIFFLRSNKNSYLLFIQKIQIY